MRSAYLPQCLLWLSLGIFLSSLKAEESVDWCSLKCTDGSENTMCKYKAVSTIGNCTNIRESTNPTIRQEMLELHNMYRNALAGGEIPGWPTAADMSCMTWDGDLELLALRWAMQCSNTHDQCRRTPEFEIVGQNIGMIGNTAFYPSSNNTFRGWVDRIKLTTSAMVTSYQDGKWAHFTQIGWANTYKLGCSEIRYNDGDLKKTTIVCNYGPAGNIASLGMYTEGEPCTKCPPRMSCENTSVYPNLCTAPTYVIPRLLESDMEASNISEKFPNVAPKTGASQYHRVSVSMKIIQVGFMCYLLQK